MNIYRAALSHFRGWWAATLGAVLLALLSSAFALLKPFPFKFIIDWVLEPAALPEFLAGWSPARLILVLALAAFAAYALAETFQYFSSLALNRLGLRGVHRLRSRLSSAMLNMPLAEHQRRGSTDLSFRLVYDAQALQTIYHTLFSTVFTALATLGLAAILMGFISLPMTAVAFGLVIPLYGIVAAFARRIRVSTTRVQETDSALLSETEDGLRGILPLQANNAQDWQQARVENRAASSKTDNLHLTRLNLLSVLASALLIAVGTGALYFLGAQEERAGRISLGDLVLFATYLVMLYRPVESLAYTAWSLEGAAAKVQRCLEILEIDQESESIATSQETPCSPDRLDGFLEFRNVDFTYQSSESSRRSSASRPVLRGFSILVDPGEFVLVLGPSGCGKSTFLKLVQRFYRAQGGEIRLGGREITEIPIQFLRSHMAYVEQEPFLINACFYDNYRIANPQVTLSDIIRASTAVEAHSFIDSLPQGYETIVGSEAGLMAGQEATLLSTGQRQRIGLGRALLRLPQASYLLLDEPTSALDEALEERVIQNIKTAIAEQDHPVTTLLVSHHENLAPFADRVIRMSSDQVQV